MSEGTSEASAAKKRKLGQRFRPEYCIEFPCLMKSTWEHFAYCKQDLSIQHGGLDEHTYTTKQLKSAKSGTPELDINYSMEG
jgi:hypothetical protein